MQQAPSYNFKYAADFRSLRNRLVTAHLADNSVISLSAVLYYV